MPSLSLGQSSQPLDEQLKSAVQTLENTDFNKARNQLDELEGQICNNNEYIEMCFELKVHQIVVNRRIGDYQKAENELAVA
ncbi:MAG: hypothetical protein WEB89_11655, partial [Balneolales bacterium]